jgi:hypothetical protein
LTLPTSGTVTALGNTVTGTGAVVLATSPTLVTPLLGTPTSGTLSACTVDGTYGIGFRVIPGNAQSANYTTVLADAGKCLEHPASDANARTFTIDSHANVTWVDGTTITFENWTAQVVTIAITTDTLVWSPTGGTGSRILAQYGVATARYTLATNKWLITGTGLS